MLSYRTVLLAGCFLGGLAVILGAFGAHAFKPMLLATNHLETYELAVRYQFYHAFALLFIGLIMRNATSPKLSQAAIFMMMGIVFFCGSLYALSFETGKSFGFVTPVGGLFFILGWVWMGWGISKKDQN